MEAGAGTGKTSLLVERVLTAIGSGVLEIDRVGRDHLHREGGRRDAPASGPGAGAACAPWRGVRARTVPKRLRSGSRIPLPVRGGGNRRRRGRERALAALEGLDRAAMVTIHAFCSELLRAHPLEAGVDPGFSVDSGEIRRPCSTGPGGEFVARELGPRPPRPDLWRALLQTRPTGGVWVIWPRAGRFRLPCGTVRGPEGLVRARPRRWPASPRRLASEIDDAARACRRDDEGTRGLVPRHGGAARRAARRRARGVPARPGRQPDIVRRVDNPKASSPKANTETGGRPAKWSEPALRQRCSGWPATSSRRTTTVGCWPWKRSRRSRRSSASASCARGWSASTV